MLRPSTPRPTLPLVRPRRPRAHARPARSASGPWGDRYGEDPDGLTLEKVKDAAARHRPRPDGAARSTRSCARRRARSSSRPPYILGDLPRLRGARSSRDARRLVLVSRRHLRSNNSWMHNVTVLVKGKDRCTLLVHPDDAARARRSSTASRPGSPREAGSHRGAGRGERRDDARASCRLPHGWGHDQPGHAAVGRPRARRA